YPQNDLFLEYPDGLHEIERHLALVEHLGIGSQGIHLEFPITWQDEDALAQAGLNVRPQEYVCIHPGSRGSWRQWPTYYFAEIADIFAARGFKVVVTGTSAEAELVNEVIHYMQYPSINAAGKTSLGAIAALIRDAYALVSNCTGVSHIAAATATRSIVISMDGEPERWAPLNKDLHYTVDWTKNPDFEAIRRTASVISSGEGITSGFSIT
ncbi:MAG TPA: glycosyltransferase family 9 protein, partial [Chitinophagaceae bacterium]|nr:glycosyltransferase family 9 protein [Chitinophagaceae bacterium]